MKGYMCHFVDTCTSRKFGSNMHFNNHKHHRHLYSIITHSNLITQICQFNKFKTFHTFPAKPQPLTNLI